MAVPKIIMLNMEMVCDNQLLQFVLGFWVNGYTGPVYQAGQFFTFVEGRNGGLVD